MLRLTSPDFPEDELDDGLDTASSLSRLLIKVVQASPDAQREVAFGSETGVRLDGLVDWLVEVTTPVAGRHETPAAQRLRIIAQNMTTALMECMNNDEVMEQVWASMPGSVDTLVKLLNTHDSAQLIMATHLLAALVRKGARKVERGVLDRD